MCQNPADELT